MKAVCRIFGHSVPQDTQVWSTPERREADGVWLALRTFCRRCGTSINAGFLYLDTNDIRAAIYEDDFDVRLT